MKCDPALGYSGVLCLLRIKITRSSIRHSAPHETLLLQCFGCLLILPTFVCGNKRTWFILEVTNTWTTGFSMGWDGLLVSGTLSKLFCDSSRCIEPESVL